MTLCFFVHALLLFHCLLMGIVLCWQAVSSVILGFLRNGVPTILLCQQNDKLHNFPSYLKLTQALKYGGLYMYKHCLIGDRPFVDLLLESSGTENFCAGIF